MNVKITDFGQADDKNFIEYNVFGLSDEQIKFLCDNLSEETSVDAEVFKIKMYFTDKLYPFQSDVAKVRLDDFIAREEIEMNVFLSSFLEDI